MAFTFCTGCGKQLDDENRFCPHCGQKRKIYFDQGVNEEGGFDGQQYGNSQQYGNPQQYGEENRYGQPYGENERGDNPYGQRGQYNPQYRPQYNPDQAQRDGGYLGGQLPPLKPIAPQRPLNIGLMVFSIVNLVMGMCCCFGLCFGIPGLIFTLMNRSAETDAEAKSIKRLLLL